MSTTAKKLIAGIDYLDLLKKDGSVSRDSIKKLSIKWTVPNPSSWDQLYDFDSSVTQAHLHSVKGIDHAEVNSGWINPSKTTAECFLTDYIGVVVEGEVVNSRGKTLLSVSLPLAIASSIDLTHYDEEDDVRISLCSCVDYERWPDDVTRDGLGSVRLDDFSFSWIGENGEWLYLSDFVEIDESILDAIPQPALPERVEVNPERLYFADHDPEGKTAKERVLEEVGEGVYDEDDYIGLIDYILDAESAVGNNICIATKIKS